MFAIGVIQRTRSCVLEAPHSLYFATRVMQLDSFGKAAPAASANMRCPRRHGVVLGSTLSSTVWARPPAYRHPEKGIPSGPGAESRARFRVAAMSRLVALPSPRRVVLLFVRQRHRRRRRRRCRGVPRNCRPCKDRTAPCLCTCTCTCGCTCGCGCGCAHGVPQQRRCRLQRAPIPRGLDEKRRGRQQLLENETPCAHPVVRNRPALRDECRCRFRSKFCVSRMRTSQRPYPPGRCRHLQRQRI